MLGIQSMCMPQLQPRAVVPLLPQGICLTSWLKKRECSIQPKNSDTQCILSLPEPREALEKIKVEAGKKEDL